ncbi:hypothetical protein ACJW8B_10565 [Plesiomonas shigelloides]|uniref:hypothetical protein n=1 Tax=Plesiomonas shigelloides TaxID=703 RepID=UPI00387F1239
MKQRLGDERQILAEYSYTRQGLPQAADEYMHWQQGRINQRGNCHYDYDRAGCLISKRQLHPGFCPEQWHDQCDSCNQMRVVITPTAERWIYRYDPFGRRISKRCEQTGEEI